MTLRDAFRSVREELESCEAWAAFWKNGRSWDCDTFRPSGSDFEFDAEELERMRKTAEEHPDAIMLHPDYCNIGSEDSGWSIKTQVDKIRSFYENPGGFALTAWLSGGEITLNEEPEAQEAHHDDISVTQESEPSEADSLQAVERHEITSIERNMDSLHQEWITATFADGLHAYGMITAGRQGGNLHIEGFANSKWEARYNVYGQGEGWTIRCGRFGGDDFSDETFRTLARALREFCLPEVRWNGDGRRLETPIGDVIYELRPDERLNDDDKEAVSIMMSGLERDNVAVEQMRGVAAAVIEMYVRENAVA